ncbi:MAG TPA: nuclear transport factor 2 family protein [Halococcus sp.]|nr:nuclear transport factor 2 family protein [Halococcus sp.]
MTSHRELVNSYYTTIDEGRYDDLYDLLAPEFVHERPDRTLDGRETFIEFMRDERPLTETSHKLDAVYRNEHELAVRGRLLDAADERLFGFVDVHTIEEGRIVRVRTFTD